MLQFLSGFKAKSKACKRVCGNLSWDEIAVLGLGWDEGFNAGWSCVFYRMIGPGIGCRRMLVQSVQQARLAVMLNFYATRGSETCFVQAHILEPQLLTASKKRSAGVCVLNKGNFWQKTVAFAPQNKRLCGSRCLQQKISLSAVHLTFLTRYSARCSWQNLPVGFKIQRRLKSLSQALQTLTDTHARTLFRCSVWFVTNADFINKKLQHDKPFFSLFLHSKYSHWDWQINQSSLRTCWTCIQWTVCSSKLFSLQLNNWSALTRSNTHHKNTMQSTPDLHLTLWQYFEQSHQQMFSQTYNGNMMSRKHASRWDATFSLWIKKGKLGVWNCWTSIFPQSNFANGEHEKGKFYWLDAWKLFNRTQLAFCFSILKILLCGFSNIFCVNSRLWCLKKERWPNVCQHSILRVWKVQEAG